MDFKAVPANIKRYMRLLDVTPKHLAVSIGIGERSLYRRFKDPGTFTLEEIELISKKLKTTISKLLETA